MRFIMTRTTMDVLNTSNKPSLDDFLSIIHSLMKDLNEECHCLPSQLEVTEPAVRQWMTVMRPLLNSPIEQGAMQLREQQKKRFDTLQQELAEKDTAMAQVTAEIQSLDQKIDDMSNTAAKLNDEKAQCQQRHSRIAELEQQIAELRAAIAKYNDLSEADVQKQRDELQSRKKACENMTREIASLQQLQQKAALEQKEKQAELDKLTQRSEEMEQQVSAIRQKIIVLQGELAQYGDLSESDVQKEQDELQRRKDACVELTRQIHALKIQQQDAQQALDETTNEFTAEQGKLEELNNQKLQKETEITQCQQEQQAIEKEVKDADLDIAALKQMISDLNEKSEDKNEEYTIKKRVYNILQEKINDLTEQINDIDKKTSDKEQEKNQKSTQKQNRLDDLSALESTCQTLQEEINAFDAKITQLQETIAQKQQRIDAFDDTQLHQQLETVTAELEQLNQKNAELQNGIAAAESRKIALTSENAALENTLSELQSRCAVATASFTRLSEEKIKMENDLKILQNDVEDLEKYFSSQEYSDVVLEIERHKNAAKIYEEGVQKLCGKGITSVEMMGQDAAAAIQQHQNTLRSQLDAINQQLDGLKTEYLTVIEETERKVNYYAM